MQVYQKKFYTKLSKELNEVLQKERFERNFKKEDYLKEKAQRLNKYMSDCGLNACVVAVSGGIDSSVTLGIASYAQKMKDSPIKKIMAISIRFLKPIHFYSK